MSFVFVFDSCPYFETKVIFSVIIPLKDLEPFRGKLGEFQDPPSKPQATLNVFVYYLLLQRQIQKVHSSSANSSGNIGLRRRHL